VAVVKFILQLIRKVVYGDSIFLGSSVLWTNPAGRTQIGALPGRYAGQI